MKKNKKMTRVQAERGLQNGSLDPKMVLNDPENFPNRHVRLRAFKLVGSDAPAMENLKKISQSAFETAEQRVQKNPEPDPENSIHPRWIQKVLRASV